MQQSFQLRQQLQEDALVLNGSCEYHSSHQSLTSILTAQIFFQTKITTKVGTNNVCNSSLSPNQPPRVWHKGWGETDWNIRLEARSFDLLCNFDQHKGLGAHQIYCLAPFFDWLFPSLGVTRKKSIEISILYRTARDYAAAICKSTLKFTSRLSFI